MEMFAVKGERDEKSGVVLISPLLPAGGAMLLNGEKTQLTIFVLCNSAI